MSVAAYVNVTVPAKLARGTNVTSPLVTSRFHVPLPDTETDVEKQFGAVSPVPHNLSRDADLPEAVSFDSGLSVTVDPSDADAESFEGLGDAGLFTVTDMVALEHDTLGVLGAHVPDTALHT